MSSLYNLEPQPTASCVLHTTSGDISLELWAQQLPLTCRNFLQHCLDGYYNDTFFHRLVPGFILQGGDPTGTGSGGESIYDGGAFSEAREQGGIWPMEDRKGQNAGPQGVGFKDEFHSRIKFNRRGMIGMANEGPDTNGSQFFLTLGDTPELQGKNTVFGRVEGDTIYNLTKMGEAEVVGNGDRPMYPTRITSVEILVNPFRDMVIRKRIAPISQAARPVAKVKRKRGGKQLLSFGDDEDGAQAPISKKNKTDTKLAVAAADRGTSSDKEVQGRVTVARKSHSSRDEDHISGNEASNPSLPGQRKPSPSRSTLTKPRAISESPEPVTHVETLLDRTNAQIAELKASMKRRTHVAPPPEKKKSILEQMIPETSVRGRKRNALPSAQTERLAMNMLNSFRQKLDQAPPVKKRPQAAQISTSSQNPVDSDEEASLCDLHFIANCKSCQIWDEHANGADDDELGDEEWLSHALHFEKDKLGKDLTFRKKAEDELVVIDPRAKERTLQEEKRANREARAGISSRQWDQAKNEKLARASALAGRGAK